MKNKVFLDTNILIYLQSGLDDSKSNKSRQLFEKLSGQNLIVLSTQVLQEFYVAMTRKLHHDPLKVKNIISMLLDFEIVTIQPTMISDAIDISILHQLSLWDSLLIACADSSHCDILYSEDLSNVQKIKGVQVVNPFV